MNAYRAQQLRVAALIEQGAAAEEIAAVLGWTTPPQKQPDPPPDRKTGDKKTLTAPQKCGIIKSIRRTLCRMKRNQEGKTMKKYYIVLYSNSTRFEPYYSTSRNSVKHLTDHGAKECRVYDSDGYLISWAQADGDYSRNVWRCAVPAIYEPMAQEYRIEI